MQTIAAVLKDRDATIARLCERLREMAARVESADEVARLLREVRAVDKKTMEELRDQVQGKRLNFDRLDGGGIKRCVKPETVRRAIWPG